MAATGEAGVTMTFAEQVETVELWLTYNGDEPLPEWLDDAFDAYENDIRVQYVGGERVLVSPLTEHGVSYLNTPLFAADEQLAGWPVGVTLNGINLYADINRVGVLAAFGLASSYDMNGEVAW